MSLSKVKKWIRYSAGIRRPISGQQLLAVKHCISFLKENCSSLGLFLYYGSRESVAAIVSKIRRGDPTLPYYLRHNATPRACATALNQFVRSQSYPIIPKRVRDLILGDNKEVSTKVIAMDALNLLSDQCYKEKYYLFYLLMDLMKKLTTDGCLRPTEIMETYGPYCLISIFFTNDYEKLRGNLQHIANILHEMILAFSFVVDDVNI